MVVNGQREETRWHNRVPEISNLGWGLKGNRESALGLMWRWPPQARKAFACGQPRPPVADNTRKRSPCSRRHACGNALWLDTCTYLPTLRPTCLRCLQNLFFWHQNEERHHSLRTSPLCPNLPHTGLLRFEISKQAPNTLLIDLTP